MKYFETIGYEDIALKFDQYSQEYCEKNAMIITFDQESYEYVHNWLETNSYELKTSDQSRKRGFNKQLKEQMMNIYEYFDEDDTNRMVRVCSIKQPMNITNLEALPYIKKQIVDILLEEIKAMDLIYFINSEEIISCHFQQSIFLMILFIVCDDTLIYSQDMHNITSENYQIIIKESLPSSNHPLIRIAWSNSLDSSVIIENKFKISGEILEKQIQVLLSMILESITTIFSIHEVTLLIIQRLSFTCIKDRTFHKNLQHYQQKLLLTLEQSTSSTLLSSELTSSEAIQSIKRELNQSVKPLPDLETGLSVFEFFSGIGGMRMALPHEIDGIPITQITAFDCSKTPNTVYEHNFHSRPQDQPALDHIEHSKLRSILIEGLSVQDVDGKCDLWTMSPPCQPFTTTRGANRKDHLDNRSKGLFHIMSLLLQMKQLPRYILVENVKGFIGSTMHGLWKQVMKTCGYQFEEYMLSPHQLVGLPNTRNRYYFIGKRHEVPMVYAVEEEREVLTSLPGVIPPPRQRLEEIITQTHINDILLSSTSSSTLSMPNTEDSTQMLVPVKILSSSWAEKMISIVTNTDDLTYCFTKGYGKIYDHSAGSCYFSSVNYLTKEQLSLDSNKLSIDRTKLDQYYGHIRMFHPNELLLLFGFGLDYQWPKDMTLQQCWSCIGNSVNVQVIRLVMQRLFSLEA